MILMDITFAFSGQSGQSHLRERVGSYIAKQHIPNGSQNDRNKISRHAGEGRSFGFDDDARRCDSSARPRPRRKLKHAALDAAEHRGVYD
jgi:hypothetical protein